MPTIPVASGARPPNTNPIVARVTRVFECCIGGLVFVSETMIVVFKRQGKTHYHEDYHKLLQYFSVPD